MELNQNTGVYKYTENCSVIHPKEQTVSEYKQDMYKRWKQRLDLLEKDYPRGLYVMKEDGEFVGLKVTIKRLLAEQLEMYQLTKEQTIEKWVIKGCKEMVLFQLNELKDISNATFNYTYVRYYNTIDPDFFQWKFYDHIPEGHTEITFAQFMKIYNERKQATFTSL